MRDLRLAGAVVDATLAVKKPPILDLFRSRGISYVPVVMTVSPATRVLREPGPVARMLSDLPIDEIHVQPLGFNGTRLSLASYSTVASCGTDSRIAACCAGGFGSPLTVRCHRHLTGGRKPAIRDALFEASDLLAQVIEERRIVRGAIRGSL